MTEIRDSVERDEKVEYEVEKTVTICVWKQEVDSLFGERVEQRLHKDIWKGELENGG